MFENIFQQFLSSFTSSLTRQLGHPLHISSRSCLAYQVVFVQAPQCLTFLIVAATLPLPFPHTGAQFLFSSYGSSVILYVWYAAHLCPSFSTLWWEPLIHVFITAFLRNRKWYKVKHISGVCMPKASFGISMFPRLRMCNPTLRLKWF